MAEAQKARVFISTTTVKVDAKGRLSVPAVLRNFLAEIGMQEVVAFPNFRKPCIECCDWARINAMADALENVDIFSDEADNINSLVFGEAVPLPWDTTGRITLPANFLEHAAITDAAVVHGNGRTFRIWNPQHFDADRKSRLSQVAVDGASLILRPRSVVTP